MSSTTTSTTSRILSEDVITLQDARRELASVIGRRSDKTTLYRRCLRGVGGVRLEHVRLGGRILTSKQAITRYVEARTAARR